MCFGDSFCVMCYVLYISFQIVLASFGFWVTPSFIGGPGGLMSDLMAMMGQVPGRSGLANWCNDLSVHSSRQLIRDIKFDVLWLQLDFPHTVVVLSLSLTL